MIIKHSLHITDKRGGKVVIRVSLNDELVQLYYNRFKHLKYKYKRLRRNMNNQLEYYFKS